MYYNNPFSTVGGTDEEWGMGHPYVLEYLAATELLHNRYYIQATLQHQP
jgi:hypothetical protein